MTLPVCSWESPPATLNLTSDHCHVWRLNLAQPPEVVSALAQGLTQAEQERAQRYYFERDRRRFQVGRGYLRQLLGRYLQQDPVQIQFNYTATGKPYLDPGHPNPILFNVSHSDELGILAFNLKDPLGVDVELVRDVSDLVQLAERFFRPHEVHLLRRVPLHLQQHVFFQFWTAKEAYLKATGEGLAGLETVEIDLTTGIPRLKSQPAKWPLTQWQLTQWIPQPHYIATLALQSSSLSIQFYQDPVLVLSS